MTWEKRPRNLAFTEAKALRLAFHDCFLYEDGTGGCDGCLNLDENLEANTGLQHTAAILEKIYTEVNFPEMPGLPNLPASPKDLGMSRADLWAFTGLLAINDYLSFTKTYCHHYSYNLTCGDLSTPCFSPLPGFASMFQTGRSDCVPSASASQKQAYVASKVEMPPYEGGNGEMTIKYFKDNFDMNATEALSLMGAHTVGEFFPMNSKKDYAWVRDRDSTRKEIFNNEYFKTLALRPGKVKDEYCTGSMDDQPAPANVAVFANVFPNRFGKPDKWAESAEKPGVMSWKFGVTRGPTCENPKEEDGKNVKFWNGPEINQLAQDKGFKNGWEWCCAEKEQGCAAKGTCPDICTRSDISGF